MKQSALAKSRSPRDLLFQSLILMGLLAMLPGCTTSTLQSIQIIPGTGAQLGSLGATLQFKAIATYTHGSHPATTQDVTSTVTWASTSPAVATVSGSGMATAASSGTTSITATGRGNLGVVTASADLIVTLAAPVPIRDLASIAISPDSQTITRVGGNAQFVAVGTFSAAPFTEDLTATVIWTSTQTSVATVSTTGLVTGVSAGTATIAASATSIGGALITNTAMVTVTTTTTTAPGLVSVAIIPVAQSVQAIGEASQFIAIGTYINSPATTQDVTSQVTWVSSDISVATINAAGLATGNGDGTTAITALITGAGGAVITGEATFTDAASGNPPVAHVASLGVYKAGTGTGLVTASYVDPQGAVTPILSCGSGPQCVGVVPTGSVVTLVAAPDGSFGGWSANCTPVTGTPTSCTLTMTNNETVASIFY